MFKKHHSKNAKSDKIPLNESGGESGRDLLIVGAGTLGAVVARIWLKRNHGATVIAETNSTSSHARLREIGALPRLRRQARPDKYPFVLFCAPPSAKQDYAAEAARAASLWDRSGKLVFTSSTGVYAESGGGGVTELSRTGSGDRVEILLAAESQILAAGGSILRLAGLYNMDHGPHRDYLRKSATDSRPDGFVNLIHYDDAGSLCVFALENGTPGALYLGCDDKAMTRKAMTDALARSTITGAHQVCRFTSKDGPLGHHCDNTFTRRILGWSPHFKSFSDWLSSL